MDVTRGVLRPSLHHVPCSIVQREVHEGEVIHAAASLVMPAAESCVTVACISRPPLLVHTVVACVAPLVATHLCAGEVRPSNAIRRSPQRLVRLQTQGACVGCIAVSLSVVRAAEVVITVLFVDNTAAVYSWRCAAEEHQTSNDVRGLRPAALFKLPLCCSCRCSVGWVTAVSRGTAATKSEQLLITTVTECRERCCTHAHLHCCSLEAENIGDCSVREVKSPHVQAMAAALLHHSAESVQFENCGLGLSATGECSSGKRHVSTVSWVEATHGWTCDDRTEAFGSQFECESSRMLHTFTVGGSSLVLIASPAKRRRAEAGQEDGVDDVLQLDTDVSAASPQLSQCSAAAQSAVYCAAEAAAPLCDVRVVDARLLSHTTSRGGLCAALLVLDSRGSYNYCAAELLNGTALWRLHRLPFSATPNAERHNVVSRIDFARGDEGSASGGSCVLVVWSRVKTTSAE